jgi:hypothetical protein
MQRFTIETPGGKRLTIEAPDQATAMQGAQDWHAQQFRPVVLGAADPMGSDGVSGDSIRSRNAGDTRGQMRTQDISSAYDVAQGRGDANEQRAMADAFVQAEQRENPFLMGVDNRIRQLARGVPVLGRGLDEASAGFSALMGGNYDKRLDYERARDRAFETSNPKEAIALQIAGGIGGGVAAAPVLAPLVTGATRGLTTLKSGLAGLGIGAVDGFLGGEGGASNRANQAVIGGALGGVVGAAAPAVAAGVSNTARRIADAIAGRKVPTGMSPGSSQVLQRVLDNDGMLGPAGAQAMARSGPSGMMADVSPGTVGLLDTAMQRGGKSVSGARDAIEQRAAAASGQIDDALTRTFGAPSGIATAGEAIRTGTQGARSTAYDRAFATPIDYAAPAARSMQEQLSRVPGSAIAQANAELRMLGHSSKQIMADVAEDGSVVFRQLPDVQQIDAITRNLRTIADRGDGQGLLGGNTPFGRAAGNLSRDIRDNLKTLVPSYGQALDVAGDAIGRNKALEFGAKAFSPSVARDEFARELRGMPAAERAAVAQGIRSRIDETLANIRSAISDPNVDARQAVSALNEFSSDAVRDKVTTLVGKEQAQALFSSMDEARRALSLRAGVAQNSKTFPRQAMAQQIDEANAPGPLGTFIAQGETGGLSQGVRALARTLLGKTPQTLQAEQDALYGEIVKALTGPRGADAQQLILNLSRRNALDQSALQAAQSGGLLTSGVAAGGAYQAIMPRQTQQR